MFLLGIPWEQHLIAWIVGKSTGHEQQCQGVEVYAAGVQSTNTASTGVVDANNCLNTCATWFCY
jgi:hypothetical protein